MPWNSYGVTDRGCVRESNQDRTFLDPLLGLYAICDGMGGHNHGELAADLAIEAMREFLEASRNGLNLNWPFGYDFKWSADANRLNTSIQLANRVIWQKAQSTVEYSGMGTTVAAVLLHDEQTVIANVGDSRIYRHRDDSVEQLSMDDTILTHLMNGGVLHATDFDSHPMRNMLSQAAGSGEEIVVHLREDVAQHGDVMLICSDGLYGVIPEPNIAEILGSDRDASQCAEFLMKRAIQLGGPDNVAVIVLRYI